MFLFHPQGLIESTVWKNKNFTLTVKIFREINSKFSTFTRICTQCGKILENVITLLNFPWIQLFSNFFNKNVDLTEKLLIFP